MVPDVEVYCGPTHEEIIANLETAGQIIGRLETADIIIAAAPKLSFVESPAHSPARHPTRRVCQRRNGLDGPRSQRWILGRLCIRLLCMKTT
jgi:hypothetical protein